MGLITITKDAIRHLYLSPLLPLIDEARRTLFQYHHPYELQVNSLLSIKTGGCPEDCAYCPQSARYQTSVDAHKLLDEETVLRFAQEAKAKGATRVCLGAAWRQVRNGPDFDKVCDMVKGVASMDLEVCCTLGMITEDQAKRLKEAGLHSYNHNVDTSKDFYQEIISTRDYDERIQTLQNVRQAKLAICCGGIIGLGESQDQRIQMIYELASMDPQPESVPINLLVPVPGTPLGDHRPEKLPIWELVRTIATCRIVIPRSRVRLSAGRLEMTDVEQTLCFLAGANSIFAGERLLTTPNPSHQTDQELLSLLGLHAQRPYDSNEASSYAPSRATAQEASLFN